MLASTHVRSNLTLAAILLCFSAGGCGDDGEPRSSAAPGLGSKPATAQESAPSAPTREVGLDFAAFSLAREAYESRLVGEFQVRWRKSAAQEVRFRQSYGGSGSQARAVSEGLEADVVALSLEQDIDLLVRNGLVQSDWKSVPNGGVVSSSIVVIAVRKGNPLSIRDWSDLVRPNLRIVNPDPLTSGAGRWNLSAIYGAALRGRVGVRADDPHEAQRFLEQVLANVVGQERDAESSFKAFAAGEGDVALASESQVNRGRMFGNDYEAVIPTSTLRIDNPIAVVRANAEKHGVREVALAFVAFLMSPDAQRAFAFYGFRPVDPAVAKSYAHQFPSPPDLFTIEDLGGWGRVSEELYAPGGVVERAPKPSPKR